jgi:hypothetical protein
MTWFTETDSDLLWQQARTFYLLDHQRRTHVLGQHTFSGIMDLTGIKRPSYLLLMVERTPTLAAQWL